MTMTDKIDTIDTTTETTEAALMEFVGKAVTDVGAVLNGSMVVLGDRLGLYRAMAGSGPLTAADLAERTGTVERYVREWLAAQAAAGYVAYEGDGRYRLPAEPAIALTDESSPACVVGAFELAVASLAATDRITEAFRTGDGMPWGEHHSDVHEGCERFFRPGYANNLVSTWLPALDGVVDKLNEGGATVADIGCGHGASTLAMAEAFPGSTFVGFDVHPASVEAARRRATEAGLADRVQFETSSGKDVTGSYDLVCFFDCLHDMGDPVGVLAHTRSILADGGTVLLVEPMAGDAVDDNLNPVGAAYYAFSTLLCTPNSLSQEVGTALGAQAGEARLAEVAADAGFSRVRRVAETPFNMVLEVRP
jgi:SAM-dependent methyltransferase